MRKLTLTCACWTVVFIPIGVAGLGSEHCFKNSRRVNFVRSGAQRIGVYLLNNKKHDLSCDVMQWYVSFWARSSFSCLFWKLIKIQAWFEHFLAWKDWRTQKIWFWIVLFCAARQRNQDSREWDRKLHGKRRGRSHESIGSPRQSPTGNAHGLSLLREKYVFCVVPNRSCSTSSVNQSSQS